MTQTYDLGAARLEACVAVTDVAVGLPFADAHPNHIGSRCMLHREDMLEREDLFASYVSALHNLLQRKGIFSSFVQSPYTITSVQSRHQPTRSKR